MSGFQDRSPHLTEQLTRDGNAVVSFDSYLLYGDRYLTAVALDAYGRKIKQTSIFLRGL